MIEQILSDGRYISHGKSCLLGQEKDRFLKIQWKGKLYSIYDLHTRNIHFITLTLGSETMMRVRQDIDLSRYQILYDLIEQKCHS